MPSLVYTTDRYLFDYEGNTGRHTCATFAAFNSSRAAQLTDVAAFIARLAALLTVDAQVTGVRIQEAGAAFTQPLGFAPSQGTNGAAVGQADFPNFIGFVGRQNGVRTRLMIFNTPQLEVGDFRLTAAERTAPQVAMINFLNLSGSTLGCTKQGAQAIWQPYVNVGVNAYYQRQARRTG
jgi:hypothetical protein